MSLFRRVVGTIMAGFIGSVILWVILPLMHAIYSIVLTWSIIDQDNPITAQMIQYGEITYMVLGIATFMVIGWTFLANATERDPRDFL